VHEFGLIEKSTANTVLQSAIKNNRNTHAYLIVGEKGVGKRSFARYSAVRFICGHTFDNCACCRRVAEAIHPDVKVIKAKGRQILIDQIRDIIADASVRPFEAEKKVYIIEQAEKMNASAQNCLLKVLEEPPAHAVFLLTAESVYGLLPTVVSRCQILRVELANPDDLAQEVFIRYNMAQDEAKSIARAAQGNIGRALMLADNREALDMRNSASAAIEALLDSDILGFIKISLQHKDLIDAYLDALIIWIRDLAFYKMKLNNRITNADVIDQIAAQSAKAETATLAKMLETVSKAEARLGRNTSAALIIDGIVLELTEES